MSLGSTVALLCVFQPVQVAAAVDGDGLDGWWEDPWCAEATWADSCAVPQVLVPIANLDCFL